MKSLFRKLGISVTSAGLLAPAIVHAQGLSDLQIFVSNLEGIVDTLIPVASALALLGFFFGLAKYIFQAGDEEAKDEGKRIMIWGVIALFLIAAVGGIIEAIAQTTGVDTGENINRTRIN